jgi:NhaP-type Na+/H+ or K+/H+ antiporter
MFKGVLFYGSEDMTWCQAFTLGSVLSATDPVAVLALLKELGASVRFNTLIEGYAMLISFPLREALLNDGTAMVFFLFFRDLSVGKGSSPLPVFGHLVNNIFVGPLIGIIISFFGAFWTRRIVNDDVEVTWLTFVFAFVAFYIAEFSFFHTSGILTVVCKPTFFHYC